MTAPNETVRAAPGVYGVELDGELLLWDAAGQALHRLNPSATSVWHALEHSPTTNGAAEIIAAQAGIDVAHAQRDVDALVNELCAAGVLERGADPTE